MCKQTTRTDQSSESLGKQSSKANSFSRRPSLLLLSKESFESNSSAELDDTLNKEFYDENHSEYWKHVAPSQTAAILNIIITIAALCVLEFILGFLFKGRLPILTDDVNHKILARHIGVDFTCCFTVAYLGLNNKEVCQEMWQCLLPTSWRTQSYSAYPLTNKKSDEQLHKLMCSSKSHARLLTYNAGAQQILLVFLAYQVKNLYDSIKWGDGMEFVFHHVVAGLAAYSGMYPGHSHFYATFFMGISEISTAVLTLLVNFDDKKGVPGLGNYLPEIKVALAFIFVSAFIICRTIIWPLATYHYIQDTNAAMRHNDMKHGRIVDIKTYLKVTRWCLIGLSVLQVLFLYQIFTMGKHELTKMGYL